MHKNTCTCPHLSIEHEANNDIRRHADSQEHDVRESEDSSPLLGRDCADYIPGIVKRVVAIIVFSACFKCVGAEVGGYAYVAVELCGVVLNGHQK